MPKIEISQDLFDSFSRRAKEKGFSSPDEYLQWVLREVAGRLPKDSSVTAPSTYTPEQEATIKDRLRSLGYID